MTQVAIVGASMAGLNAAIMAASHGASVTVYEQKKDVRSFYGGEVLTQFQYGLMSPNGSTEPEGANYYADNFVFYVNGVHKVPLPPKVIWMVDRDIYQEALAKKAASLGAEIRLETPAPKLSMLQRLYDTVIDASGCPSVTSREYGVGKVKEIATALYYLASGDFSKYNHDLHMWWLEKKTLGYFWIFPKANGTKANLGIGWVLNGARPEKRGDIGIGWVLNGARPPRFSDIDQYLFLLGIPSPVGGRAFNVDERGGHIVPLRPVRHKRFGKVLLTGDAAGLMNSTLAAGNHLAAASGRLAGLLAAQGHPERYESVLNEIIGAEMRNSQLLYRVQKRISFDAFDSYFPVLAAVGPEIFFTRRALVEAGARFAWAEMTRFIGR